MTETDFYADESLELGEGRPEEPKGQYDRYILPRGDGQAMEYTRTTTLVGTVDSGVGLGIWRKYRAAWGVAQRDDLINRLRAVPADDHATIREICDKAELIAGTDAAANDGTAAHAVLQRVDQGEAIEAIHPYYHPLVRNYQAELAHLGITVLPQYVERTCRCARLDAGGKPDNIYQLDDGSLVVGDKKTTADLIKAERAIAAQLGIYANCEHMFDYVTGRYEPMPPVRKDFALIILIDTDTWAVTIESINIEYGWARTRLMVELRESNKVKGLRHPYLPGGRWDLKPKTVLPAAGTPSIDSYSPANQKYIAQQSAYAGQVDTWNAQGQQQPAAGQHPCGDCGAPDYIIGPHTAQCSQNPDNIAAYEAGRNGSSPSPERSAESVARVAAIANGVLDAAHQRAAAHHPEGLVVEHGVVTPAAVTQTGPVGVLDASPTPQAATTPAPQPPTTVGPRPNTTPPPTPSNYPAVDPQTRVQEIMDVRKNDKTRLQHWAKALGCTDLAHHRKWLAEWIVAATPDSGAIEPAGEGDTGPGNPQTLAQTGLPPAPATPPGQSVVGASTDHPVQDNTPEVLAHKAANAASLDVLRAVWKTYTDTYGPDSWEASGPVKAAADVRADFIKRQLAGDDGPPF